LEFERRTLIGCFRCRDLRLGLPAKGAIRGKPRLDGASRIGKRATLSRPCRGAFADLRRRAGSRSSKLLD
jgi:hypothetical protein